MRAAWKAREMGKDLTRAALCFCACNFLAAALAAQCPSPVTLILDQTLTSGNNNWRSNGSLKATNYTVSGSASVTFVAGQCIELAPNFHATAGTVTTFHAWVDALPTVSDASPKDGAGTSGQITWTASSPYGYGYLTTLVGDIGTSFTARDSCYVIFNASNVLQLADNRGTFPQANRS